MVPAAALTPGRHRLDCVRSARRIGFDDVKLLYRRTEAEMPADPVEIAEAKEEGVEMVTLVAPTKIIAEDGKVVGLECRRMQLGEPDSSGRRRPEPVDGSEFVIPCDCIVPAIGQVCGVDQLVPSHIEVSKWKTLEVDPLTMQSADPRVFGGGDCYTGPSSLVAALGAGRRAAESMNAFLQGASVGPPPAVRPTWSCSAVLPVSFGMTSVSCFLPELMSRLIFPPRSMGLPGGGSCAITRS